MKLRSPAVLLVESKQLLDPVRHRLRDPRVPRARVVERTRAPRPRRVAEPRTARICLPTFCLDSRVQVHVGTGGVAAAMTAEARALSSATIGSELLTYSGSIYVINLRTPRQGKIWGWIISLWRGYLGRHVGGGKCVRDFFDCLFVVQNVGHVLDVALVQV